MEFMSLPTDVIENVLSYLSYDEISQNRIVSRAFNRICMGMLNRGFNMIDKSHKRAYKNMEARLPRRESKRWNHPLTSHWAILISMMGLMWKLKNTYCKYIDNRIFCFIPGKVIDEIGRVLTILKTETKPLCQNEVLQELRDLCTMAREHFSGAILPTAKRTVPRELSTAEFREMMFLKQAATYVFKEMSNLNFQMDLISDEMKEHSSLVTLHSTNIKTNAKIIKDLRATLAHCNKRLDMLVITHDYQFFGTYAEARAKFEKMGQVKKSSTKTRKITKRKRIPYGCRLLRSMTKKRETRKKLQRSLCGMCDGMSECQKFKKY